MIIILIPLFVLTSLGFGILVWSIICKLLDIDTEKQKISKIGLVLIGLLGFTIIYIVGKIFK